MKAKEKKQKSRSRLRDVLGGDVLESKALQRQIPLLLLILVFCVAMVGIRYRVEGLNKEKQLKQRQVSYLREHRVQMQKNYQESIRISRIDQQLDTIKVGLVAGPPFELKIEQ